MALYSGVYKTVTKSWIAEEDVDPFRTVKFGTDTNGVVYTNAQGEKAIGVTLHEAKKGQPVEVLHLGICPVVVAAAAGLSRGSNITPSATAGKVEVAAAGDYVIGTLLDVPSADGDQILAFIDCLKFEATVA